MKKVEQIEMKHELNPINAAKILNESIRKENRFREIWDRQDHARTGGYTGEKFRINDPRKATYMPDKVTEVTPSLPYKKQVLKNEDSQNENTVQRAFMLNALERRIRSANLTSKQKSPYAMTAN